ncbi:protein phosphatase 2C domain-containing protein [Streptomyces buecherae]|uniref:protein phosphatase 2C domain-containing protein n=1 Tax=Streptomyces buecherae TaxID=2763006 RepID=UPI0037BD31AD
MSQQGEHRHGHEDDWWRELYEADQDDTGPAVGPDSLDDRFDSAAQTLGTPPDQAAPKDARPPTAPPQPPPPPRHEAPAAPPAPAEPALPPAPPAPPPVPPYEAPAAPPVPPAPPVPASPPEPAPPREAAQAPEQPDRPVAAPDTSAATGSPATARTPSAPQALEVPQTPEVPEAPDVAQNPDAAEAVEKAQGAAAEELPWWEQPAAAQVLAWWEPTPEPQAPTPDGPAADEPATHQPATSGPVTDDPTPDGSAPGDPTPDSADARAGSPEPGGISVAPDSPQGTARQGLTGEQESPGATGGSGPLAGRISSGDADAVGAVGPPRQPEAGEGTVGAPAGEGAPAAGTPVAGTPAAGWPWDVLFGGGPASAAGHRPRPTAEPGPLGSANRPRPTARAPWEPPPPPGTEGGAPGLPGYGTPVGFAMPSPTTPPNALRTSDGPAAPTTGTSREATTRHPATHESRSGSGTGTDSSTGTRTETATSPATAAAPDGNANDATGVVPTDAEPTSGVPAGDPPTRDVPTTRLPTRGAPPADVPPRDLPTRDLPTRDLPTRQVPPRQAPPRDVPSSSRSAPIREVPATAPGPADPWSSPEDHPATTESRRPSAPHRGRPNGPVADRSGTAAVQPGAAAAWAGSGEAPAGGVAGSGGAGAVGAGAAPRPAGPPGAQPFRSGQPRGEGEFIGVRPPTYAAEPTALPPADAADLDALVPDTTLDGASYGPLTLRAVSSRGDSARYRGEPRRDALLTARFGSGDEALLLVAVASGARAAPLAHRAARELCASIGGAIGRSHVRLADDVHSGRRAALKSGLQRLTDRAYVGLRAHAHELGLDPTAYTASLRCLLLPVAPDCRTRVFFGVGDGGLFRLRDGAWQDVEPAAVPVTATPSGHATAPDSDPTTASDQAPPETDPAAPYAPPARAAAGSGPRPPADPRIAVGLSPAGESVDAAPEAGGGGAGGADEPPAAPGGASTESTGAEAAGAAVEPFRFQAAVARPGDVLLLCGPGLAEPFTGQPALADALRERWSQAEPPGLAAYLADVRLRVKGYADDRTAVTVWEA